MCRKKNVMSVEKPLKDKKVKSELTVTAKNPVTIDLDLIANEYKVNNRLGHMKGSITTVLGMLLTADVIEECKSQLSLIKDHLNNTKLL